MLPDDREKIRRELIRLSDEVKCDLILTTGGTGFSPRDITPVSYTHLLRKEFTKLRHSDEYAWLLNISNNVTKQAIKDEMCIRDSI